MSRSVLSRNSRNSVIRSVNQVSRNVSDLASQRDVEDMCFQAVNGSVLPLQENVSLVVLGASNKDVISREFQQNGEKCVLI
jgi:hypothetical protein